MKRWAANQFARVLGRRGYTITRPRFHEENEIDLRGMLAEPIERAKGRFVVLQIGANDGTVNDPIHDLVIERSWDLYAVEPVPAPFERLQETYREAPHVRCIRCAVGSIDGELPIYILEAGVQNESEDQLASFSRETLSKHWRHIPNLENRIRTVMVRSLTLSSLLRDYNIPKVDMLQIDTEGFDYEVIKMAFAANLFPPILSFEWEHLSQADMWSCRTDLIRHGYEWLLIKGDVVASRQGLTTSTEPDSLPITTITT